MSNHLTQFTKGSCKTMCPEDECRERVATKSVHRLEYSAEGQQLLVKRFSRSAAGNRSQKPGDLRPSEVCLQTTVHLIRIFLGESRKGSSATLGAYEFVFDRLRSVRQDIVIQHGDFESTKDEKVSMILQHCALFHLLANYYLCEVPAYDAKLNFVHQLECLKSLLVLLGNIDPNFTSDTSISAAAIYLITNLGSSESIRWALGLPKSFRSHPLIKLSLGINFLYLERNFVALFRKARELPIAQLLAFHWNLPQLYSDVFNVMSVAYSSKTSQFPIDHFVELFLINDQTYCKELCKSHNVQTSDSGIRFLKRDVDPNKVKHRKWFLLENVIEENVEDLFWSH